MQNRISPVGVNIWWILVYYDRKTWLNFYWSKCISILKSMSLHTFEWLLATYHTTIIDISGGIPKINHPQNRHYTIFCLLFRLFGAHRASIVLKIASHSSYVRGSLEGILINLPTLYLSTVGSDWGIYLPIRLSC